MKKVVFDIETKNIFQDVGSSDPVDLDISLVGLYDYENNSYSSFLQEDFSNLWNILEKTDMLITYNGDHFDIPLLNKYYKKDGRGDLTKIRSLDLLKEIKLVLVILKLSNNVINDDNNKKRRILFISDNIINIIKINLI